MKKECIAEGGIAEGVFQLDNLEGCDDRWEGLKLSDRLFGKVAVGVEVIDAVPDRVVRVRDDRPMMTDS